MTHFVATMKDKTLKLPKKALYANYRYGAFEFSTSEKNYENGFDEYIELPKWMIEAIEEYADNKAKIAVEEHLKEVRKMLGISP